MLKLAWSNLTQDRTRLAISVGGVALAFLLILVINGVFAGSEEHAVIYIKKQPASLWMMQAGVENMHMASSILPVETIAKVQTVTGVDQAVGLLYTNAGVDLGDTVVYSYIFAVDSNVPFGGPWKLAEGSKNPALDEVIIDQDLAARYGLGLGSKVEVLGHELTIAGLSEETFGIATNISFVNKQALASLLGVSPEAASYILVQPDPLTNQEALAEELSETFQETNLMSQSDFIASDKEMIRQMGTDVINAMNSIAYVVGLLVIGLTIYTATLERAREYGMLKAIGANNLDLFKLVMIQALISAGFGLIVSIFVSYSMATLISELLPEMLVLIEPSYVLQQMPILLGITLLSAMLPLGRIARLDPMIVFKA